MEIHMMCLWLLQTVYILLTKWTAILSSSCWKHKPWCAGVINHMVGSVKIDEGMSTCIPCTCKLGHLSNRILYWSRQALRMLATLETFVFGNFSNEIDDVLLQRGLQVELNLRSIYAEPTSGFEPRQTDAWVAHYQFWHVLGVYTVTKHLLVLFQ